MNIDNFLKKIYTVAFRLTGDENKADYLAFKAISNSSSKLSLSDIVTSNMLDKTVLEVCRLFLAESNRSNEIFKIFKQDCYDETFQEALMSLKPLSRATVVWRDILNKSLEEMSMIGYNRKELYFELNNGRKLLKEFLNKAYLNETGA